MLGLRRSRAPRALSLAALLAACCVSVALLALGWPLANAGPKGSPHSAHHEFHVKPRKSGEHGSTNGVLPVMGVAAMFVYKSKFMSSGEPGLKHPTKAPRITAFDSMRFFLIMYIMCGHFISFAKPSLFALKAITQINVVVGAFFALSGYVAAYTTTEIGDKKAKDKVVAAPAPQFIVQRVFGYWPLHMLVLLLFSPVFIYADYTFSGPVTTLWHALLAVTMTQAWFPLHAEIWNAPTWFLGALTFATVLQPYFTPLLAKQGKKELRRTAMWLTLCGLLPKIAYCYDFGSWGLLEGALSPKAFANLAIFNTLRFCPVFAVIEVMLGFVACRLVMLDGAHGEEPVKKTQLSDTALPLAGMIAIILLRATGLVMLSDMIVRPCIFMPLFLLFLMGIHRASIQETITDPVAKFMKSAPLVWLGGLSFPIFVVHGPLGQLFYKKAIASKLWGGPMNVVCGPWFFYVYLLTVLVAAFFLNKYFMSSKKVGEMSQAMQAKLLKYL